MDLKVAVHEDSRLAEAVREIVLEGYEGPPKRRFQSVEQYRWLRDAGSKLWLDTGDEKAATRVWGLEIEGLTTNNTLVNQVVATGAMDGLIGYSARRIRDAMPGISDGDLVYEVGFAVNSKVALKLVGDFGAQVSVELHPDFSSDIRASLVFARRYYEVNPDFFVIKVPLSPDGFIAARLLSSEGVPVNFTLGFSARQNYLAAIFARPRYVNVFLGRLNSVVQENGLGRPKNIGEKAALASYEVVRELRRSTSGLPTQQVAASMRSGDQLPVLAGIDVLTVPPKVMEQYLDIVHAPDQLQRASSRSLRVDLNQDRPVEADAVRKLWEIDETVVAFSQVAAQIGDQMASGSELIQLAADHEIDLFSRWTEADRQAIREHGKIPDLSDWPGVAVDELMSVCGLQSFAKDQQELDDRIAGIVRSA